MIVALQTGLTRVATMMIGPERWNTPYMFEGVFDKPRSHHQMSHNQTKFIDDLAKVDRFYMEQFAYLVEKMSGIKEKSALSNKAWDKSTKNLRKMGLAVVEKKDNDIYISKSK